MLINIKNLCKKYDRLGHPIHINFNKQGPVYTTACGGLITLLVSCLLVMVTGHKILQVYNNDENGYSTNVIETDFEEIGTLSFDQINFVPYFIVRRL